MKEKKSFWDIINLDFRYLILVNIILEVLFLILGGIMFIRPYDIVECATIMLGIYLIIISIFDIYLFWQRNNNPLFKNRLFVAILTIILGILVILNPFKLTKILTLVLGIYLIVKSIFKILESIKFKKYGYEGWKLILVSNIILLVFGIFIAINPMAYMALTKAAGIYIILASILDLCDLFMMYKENKQISKILNKIKKI